MFHLTSEEWGSLLSLAWAGVDRLGNWYPEIFLDCPIVLLCLDMHTWSSRTHVLCTFWELSSWNMLEALLLIKTDVLGCM